MPLVKSVHDVPVGVIFPPQVPFDTCVHVPVALQTSVVQPLPSLVHVVPDGWKPSAGQAPVEPVQLSATSHGPAEGRQVVVAGWNPSTQ
jgi:hypothetical protein